VFTLGTMAPVIPTLAVFFCYFAAFLVFLIFTFLVRKKRREGRFPLGQNVFVGRRAGEHLSQELARYDENFDTRFLTAVALPLFGMGLPIVIAGLFGPVAHWGVLAACVALTAAALIGGITWLLRTVDRMRDTRLGLFGERVVADCLDDLRGQGYSVFHDVPCKGATGPFNLDHVVVGGGAVTVVETKTYRKRAPEGKDDHKVSYDGRCLIWPDRKSTQELDQAEGNAHWLETELKTKLNIDVAVNPALTIPGWFVSGGPPGQAVLVENHKRLAPTIRQRIRGPLTTAQMELIRRHLRSLTSNVDFAAV
jgi:Nuclease-related domain